MIWVKWSYEQRVATLHPTWKPTRPARPFSSYNTPPSDPWKAFALNVF